MRIAPLSASIGARVEDFDPGALDETRVKELRHGVLAHKVLFFGGAGLDPAGHVALARLFGIVRRVEEGERDDAAIPVVDGHPEIFVVDGGRAVRANVWHTDATFSPDPPIAGVLAMRTSPPRGGDTLWSDTEQAFATLSEPVRQLVEELVAVHGRAGRTGDASHPIVRVHPVTGHRALYVNRGWTSAIVGLSADESAHVLAMLFEHMERPEFTVRWSWSVGDVAVWDNRCTMHYVLDDFGGAERVAHLVWCYES